MAGLPERWKVMCQIWRGLRRLLPWQRRVAVLRRSPLLLPTASASRLRPCRSGWTSSDRRIAAIPVAIAPRMEVRLPDANGAVLRAAGVCSTVGREAYAVHRSMVTYVHQPTRQACGCVCYQRSPTSGFCMIVARGALSISNACMGSMTGLPAIVKGAAVA